jgi:hypothetical protein
MTRDIFPVPKSGSQIAGAEILLKIRHKLLCFENNVT